MGNDIFIISPYCIVYIIYLKYNYTYLNVIPEGTLYFMTIQCDLKLFSFYFNVRWDFHMVPQKHRFSNKLLSNNKI